MLLYHGSKNIINKPLFGHGNAANDYGIGFYCTENYDIAGEWACKRKRDGFINQYEFNDTSLTICNLNSPDYNILNWLAVLTRFRGYWQKNSIAEQAKAFLQENYYIDLTAYDVITGYRADDSYFSFAQDFISGGISLRKLSNAMYLGKLGEQVVLKSEKAFERISYITNDPVFAEVYYPQKHTRDLEARRAYANERSTPDDVDDIYILDILRGKVNEDDLRI